jgi:L-alanine-DL-glutamate epimerase-like enolase superfamily enzyme
MQITEIRAHALSVPYDEPRWTAHERMERDQVVLVEVRTDQGLVGYGEIAGGPQKTICDLVAMFADVVKGMDPLGHTGLWP